MFGLLKKSEDLQQQRGAWDYTELPAEKAAKAALPDKPIPVPIQAMPESALAEYAQTAASVDFHVPALLIEQFKLFLVQRDLPCYDLKAVVTYMDAIAKRDNPRKLGWQWVPLRKADTEAYRIRFGRAADREDGKVIPASDYYASHGYYSDSAPTPPYDKFVPMHALNRVGMIEAEFGKGSVVFAISDYATELHVPPDPFLMAMIPNSRVKDGVGRFVIDVWDEPGFGIMEMVKA